MSQMGVILKYPLITLGYGPNWYIILFFASYNGPKNMVELELNESVGYTYDIFPFV